ncbi:hypothetical protein FO519_008387 [Halicephalobus sp. NKZ332]|nr:hypothetical protein FO519_008387 [Halicephalobus sp. NKZ332]
MTEQLTIIGFLISWYILIQCMDLYYRTRVRQGVAFSDIGAFQRGTYLTLNWASLLITLSLIVWIVWRLAPRQSSTFYDYIEFCLPVLILGNSIIKSKTIKSLFRQEHVKVIDDIMNTLHSSEAKTKFEEILREQKTLDDIVYFIRNVRQIKNPTMFFEIIKKTEATVHFAADGLVVSPNSISEIKIHPKAYNQIGKYTGKIEEIRKDKAGTEIRAVIEKYFRGMEWTKINDRDESRTIINQPLEQRAEFLKKVLGQQGIDVSINVVRNIMNNGLDEALSKAIPDIPDSKEAMKKLRKLEEKEKGKTLTNDKQQKVDKLKSKISFQEEVEEFRQLKAQELRGTLSEEKQARMVELEIKCEEHRKEYFFEASTIHAKDVLYMEKSSKIEKELVERNFLEKEGYERVREYRLVVDRMVLLGKWKDSDIKDELVKARWESDQIIEMKKEVNEIDPFFQNIKKSTAQFIKDIKTFTDDESEGFLYTIHIKYVDNVLYYVFKTNDLSEIFAGKTQTFPELKIRDYERLKKISHKYGFKLVELLNIVKIIGNDTYFNLSADIKTWDDFASLIEIIALYAESEKFLNEMMEKEKEYKKFVKKINSGYEEIQQIKPHKDWDSKINMFCQFLKHADEFASSSTADGNLKDKAQDYFGKYSERIFKDENLVSEIYSQDGSVKIMNYVSTFRVLIHIGLITVFHGTEGGKKKIATHFIQKEGKYIE